MHDSRAVSLAYATSIALAWRSGNIPENVDRFVALNQFSASKLAAGGVPSAKIDVCGNFISTCTDSPAAKQPYILYLGRLSREKGLRTLLDAWDTGMKVTLKLAGTGPLEPELRAYVEANVCNNIEFTGFVTGSVKDQLIRDALCTIVPSEWYENFPVSILESYAYATPVIASRIGGLPEMVKHEKTGLLFKPGDSADLKRCIARIIENPQETAQMANNALHAARVRFGPDEHYRRLLEIYDKARNDARHSMTM
jgi:glycosyltransferase involved in cell wall biosynthesis